MKIKKVNELYGIDSNLSEDELNEFRKKRFDIKYDKEYEIYGEYFANGDFKPQYTLLYSDYNINNIINWFTVIDRIKYRKYILIERNEESKILDLDLVINSNKYNL